MLGSVNRSTAVRLALIGVAAVSMAACSSRPKPQFNTTPPATTPPPASQGADTPPPVSQGPLAATPGSAQDFVVNVGDRVYFDLDSHDVRDDARALLDAQADWLRRYNSVRVRIEGNADERGTREYNLALGARRANAVRDYLVSRGVTSDRISTISFGKEQPLDPGASEEAYQKNRNARTAIVSGAR
ncbi:peptidoglycan-associated lipoprotein Pal [Phenylobacterium sp. VNQ135]|uniref:peptidoglycan-associated lipoprotein Pal n=1 Tax=Phenylobacterium sp. VNQ135 TaxID=3400922 RepID=UPI003C106A08